MDLKRYTTPDDFYRHAERFLAAHEAENNLPIGICTTRLAQPERIEPDMYLATVEDDGEIVLAALRTPPYDVVLSLMPRRDLAASAIAPLVADVRAVYADRVPGVIGPSHESQLFGELWGQETGQTVVPFMQERIYRLESVVSVTGVPGYLRRASHEDRDLLIRWSDAFNAEAHTSAASDSAAWADQALTSPARAVYFWVDSEPVTMVGRGGFTPHGARIGPVYTPPEQRRHGYASACTAAVSQLELDSGRRFCFLFTNLANPTANHIYQTIGYRAVCDAEVYHFRERA
ncbi:MAG TPA: GNAT family N-acetyltransferase [Ktedonobacterales bacterium]